MERCWRNGGRVFFGYGKGRATGEMRAKAVETAFAWLTSIEENGLALNVMVLIAGAGQSLMLQEYDDVVQAIHAVIPDTAWFEGMLRLATMLDQLLCRIGRVWGEVTVKHQNAVGVST